MATTYLLDDTSLTPDVLAKRFGHYNTENGSYWSLIADSAEKLGIGDVEFVYCWDDGVEEALRNGQLVISIQSKGLFTNGGHFILLTGINEDERVTVHDPNSWNWIKNNYMKESFENGFTFEDIRQDSEAYWIYPKKPEPIVEPVEKVPSVPNYYQGERETDLMSGGILAGDESGLVSLAMVASYLKDNPALTPNKLAYKFEQYSSILGPTSAFFDSSAKELRLGQVFHYNDWDETKITEALNNEQIIIACQYDWQGGGNFHYIVLTGINENGNIFINDPALREKPLIEISLSEIAESNVAYWIYDTKSNVLNNGFSSDVKHGVVNLSEEILPVAKYADLRPL